MPTRSNNISSSLTRNDLREAVYKQIPQISRETARRITDEVFEEIVLALLQNEKVKLRGFGVFNLQHKKERLGRNPKSGIDAVITARRSVKFLPSPVLRAKVNGEDLSNLDEDAE